VRARLFRGDEVRATLTWSDGEIWTKSPDDDVLAMLLQVANRLDARVRGDELETYRGVGDTYVHPDDRADRTTSERDIQRLLARRRLWRALRLAALVIACGLLLLNAFR
jgi:hypothetical protein